MTDTLTQARWFAERGCSVIPIEHPDATTQEEPRDIGKKPLVQWKEYQQRLPTDAELVTWFGNGHKRNIGLVTGKLSNRVVIDCDSPAAILWAEAHLPPTPWRSRTGKGEHWPYQYPGVPVLNKVFLKTGDPAVLIDVRGDGGYIVAPGSQHANGTSYWWVDGEPAPDAVLPMFDPAWITGLARKSKAKAKTAPSTLGVGSRNDTLFREGCRLREQGFDEAGILAALKLYNDQLCKPPLELHEVEELARQAAKYEPGTASEVEAAVEKLNERYFLIDVGTDTVVGEYVTESMDNRQWTDFRFRSFTDFKNKLIKHQVKEMKPGKDGVEVPQYKPLADVWLRNRNGKQFNRLVYAPEGSNIHVGPDDHNGWKGFTVKPAPGSWSLTRNTLIWKVICREDEALFNFTLDWTADLFQRPGQHGETGLVLTGKQGSGKTFFAEFVLGRTFDARHARVTTHARQIGRAHV